MVADASRGGLSLTQAQRTLAEKTRDVKQQRIAALEAQHELQSRSRLQVQETKVRCRSQHTPAAGRLILRHVGEKLAHVAYRERLLSKCSFAPPHVINNYERKASASNNDEDQAQQKPQNADDGYDEARFGSVRRPPRKQPLNLWVPIFEQEVAEVKREKVESQRKRLARAKEYRTQLAQLEAEKQRQRLDEKNVAEAFARAQAAQQATWREQEKNTIEAETGSSRSS